VLDDVKTVKVIRLWTHYEWWATLRNLVRLLADGSPLSPQKGADNIWTAATTEGRHRFFAPMKAASRGIPLAVRIPKPASALDGHNFIEW